MLRSPPFFIICSILFRRWCFWKCLGLLWLPFGLLLAPFGSFWIPVLIHFELVTVRFFFTVYLTPLPSGCGLSALAHYDERKNKHKYMYVYLWTRTDISAWRSKFQGTFLSLVGVYSPPRAIEKTSMLGLTAYIFEHFNFRERNNSKWCLVSLCEKE